MNPLFDHDLGGLERRLGYLIAGERQVPADVVRTVRVGLVAAWLRRLLDVHHGRYRLIFDVNQLGGVCGLGLRLRDHDRHDLALIAGFALRDGEVFGHVLLDGNKDRQRGESAGKLPLEIARGVDGRHSIGLRRCGDVDLLDQGVRVGTAHKRDVGNPYAREVIGEVPMAGDQTGIFTSLDPGANQLGDGHLLTP